MPQGTTFLFVENYGNSAWTVTGKISALEPDGTEKLYFLKVCNTVLFTTNESPNAKKAISVGCVWRAWRHLAERGVRVVQGDIQNYAGFHPRAFRIREIQSEEPAHLLLPMRVCRHGCN